MRTAIRTTLAVALAIFFAVTVPACRTTQTDSVQHERHNTGIGSHSHSFRE